MFDTMAIAARIKQARIDKNMTQMQLADIMGVSYQAVSNWERGNSMPDISKLGDLCSALDLTVNDLLGMEEKTAAAVTKAMEQEELTVEELKEVAPVLPPEDIKARTDASIRKIMDQTNQIIEETNHKIASTMESLHTRMAKKFGGDQKATEQPPQSKKKKVDLSAIAELAPFLDAEYLDQLIMEAELNDLDGLDEIVPFLSEKTLRHIALHADADNMDVLVDVAPFLNEQTIRELIQRCLDEDAGDMISELAPFATEGTLDSLVDSLMARQVDMEDLDWDVSEIYPFLGKDTLRKLAKHLLDRRDYDALSDLKDHL